MSLQDLRREYEAEGLHEADVDTDPFVQFGHWLDAALASGLPEPNAMTLATVGAGGRPAARVVLLRGFDPRGLVFYTNYESRKGGELAASPWAALVFYWADLHRQVRVEGRVARVADAESDAYFAGRPAGSRLGAIASPQSQVIPDCAALDRRIAALAAEYGAGPIPRPPYWGGYRVTPDLFEFWQGQPNRLHDRLRYRPTDGGGWVLERLAP